MAKTEAQPKQSTRFQIAWLSNGMLKTSILLRQEAARTGRTLEALDYLLAEKFVPERAVAAFSSVARPTAEVALGGSYDYSRCLLAKSIAEVYRRVTPKYRNETARGQFLKRLAHTAEAIHLAESNTRFQEMLNSIAEEDDVRTWVGIELDRLVQQKCDLASEYIAKLGSARMEFAAAIRELERLVGVGLRESDCFTTSPRICSFFPPGITENENTWRWGSQWYPRAGVLNLNPPILFVDPLRRGVLAREAAILLSPRNLEALERELCEQSEFLAYRLFERKTDREFWAEARHGLRQRTRFRAHELIDFFHFYEMMVGDSLYRELWSRLKEFGNTKLTFSDYLNVFTSLASRPTEQEFNEEELRLLDLLCKRPNVGAGEAARLLGVSIPTAMKAIRDMSKKAGLSFTILVDMQKIGLIEHLVAVQTSESTKVLSILSRFPYCRQVFRTYGSFDLFCVWDVPSVDGEFAEKFLNRMNERDLIKSYKLLVLKRDLQSVNFERYDVEERRWDVHWDSWSLSLRDSLDRQEQWLAETSSENSRFEMDKLDLNILSSLQINCRTPFSAIGRILGISGAYVGRRVTRMAQQGIFRYAVWPMKIGAEDWGMLAVSCSKRIAGALAQNLSKLPAWRGGLVAGAFDGLIAMVWCPNGELKQFFKAIDDRLIKTSLARVEGLNSIGEWAIARWLPVDPDDPWKLFGENGKWLFDEAHYMALLEQ
jgi:DNA-binding Lrp family transcriptional regulator